MSINIIRSPPNLAEYLPVAEYLAQTPASFSHGKPILHAHILGARAIVARSKSSGLFVFPPDAPVVAGGDVAWGLPGEEVIEQNIDVWVGSNYFIIFNPRTKAGVQIPYPSVSIHAIKSAGEVSGSQAIWMMLRFFTDDSDGSDFENDFHCAELTIIPPSSCEATVPQIYEAITICSNQHPDRKSSQDDEDEDDYDRPFFDTSAPNDAFREFTEMAESGNMPDRMPGGHKWITIDNLHEFYDENGNWKEPDNDNDNDNYDDELMVGAGAGRTRPHDELEGANGHDDWENKRPRVD